MVDDDDVNMEGGGPTSPRQATDTLDPGRAPGGGRCTTTRTVTSRRERAIVATFTDCAGERSIASHKPVPASAPPHTHPVEASVAARAAAHIWRFPFSRKRYLLRLRTQPVAVVAAATDRGRHAHT